MPRGRPENLKPLPTLAKEAQREIRSKGGKAAAKVKQEKKLMSQIYAEFLAAQHNIEIDGERKKLSGQDLVAVTMKSVLARADSSAVSMLREIREGTEGSKVKATGELKIEWPEALKKELGE